MILANDICFTCKAVIDAEIILLRTVADLKLGNQLNQLAQEMKEWFDIKTIMKIMGKREKTVEAYLTPVVKIDSRITDAVLDFKDALVYNREVQSTEEELIGSNAFALICKCCNTAVYRTLLTINFLSQIHDCELLEDYLLRPASNSINTADQLIPVILKGIQSLTIQKKEELKPSITLLARMLSMCRKFPQAEPNIVV